MTTLEKHRTAVMAGVVSKANVTGIKKLINAAERREQGYSTSSTAPKATVTETLELRRLIAEREPAVAVDLHASGLKVLRNPRYAKRWNERERAIIDRLSSFRLVGFDRIARWQSVPVYRAISATGQSFCFRNIPWQTVFYVGGDLEDGPRVVERPR